MANEETVMVEYKDLEDFMTRGVKPELIKLGQSLRESQEKAFASFVAGFGDNIKVMSAPEIDTLKAEIRKELRNEVADDLKKLLATDIDAALRSADFTGRMKVQVKQELTRNQKIALAAGATVATAAVVGGTVYTVRRFRQMRKENELLRSERAIVREGPDGQTMAEIPV